ncbi:hypothetical protein DFJ64_1828 [Thermasporomyces composti]|uniref:Uncharacterized protein n=1 Tax=Thermasporomyces composti TaxID=696763 RepID=A0A3D9V8E1_THECX|nr:hypothetical protein DFJ64_1828 [Thermasporomyces composti]
MNIDHAHRQRRLARIRIWAEVERRRSERLRQNARAAKSSGDDAGRRQESSSGESPGGHSRLNCPLG